MTNQHHNLMGSLMRTVQPARPFGLKFHKVSESLDTKDCCFFINYRYLKKRERYPSEEVKIKAQQAGKLC